jgi:hypothetical protein
MTIPKYVATCVEDEEVSFYESGDTPDIAFDEFLSSGQFSDYCNYYDVGAGYEIDVFIYTAIDPKDSDYDEDEINPAWTFVLDCKVETRRATSV